MTDTDAPTDDPEERYLSLEDVAERVRESEATVLRLIEDGKLQAHAPDDEHPGLRVTEAEVTRYLLASAGPG